MKDLFTEALQALVDHDNTGWDTPYYRRLLVADISDAMAELSFVECCGLLSAFYDCNDYYPEVVDGDIYSFMKSSDDYLLPLGLVVLAQTSEPVSFFSCRI